MAIPLKTGTTQPGPVLAENTPAAAPLSAVQLADLSESLHNTMVIYGPTGSRKTTQAGEFAKYIYAKTGKITRLLTADGGGFGPIQDVVNAGIIEPWRVVEEKNPKVAIIKASKGAWPDKLVNGLRVSKTITEPITAEAKAKAMAGVGAYIVEGWYSIATLLMGDLVAKGQKINEDIVGKFEEQTEYGNETFGAPGRSHYMWVQNFILTMIRNFSSLPVERVLYTSIEGKGEDGISKVLQYGPAVAGKAITAAIPQHVGDCLHFEDFVEDGGVDPTNAKQKLVTPQVRVWFRQHPDAQTGVMWPAKARIIGSKAQEFAKQMGPNGYFVLDDTHNLGTYLALQDKILSAASDDMRKWKEEVDRQRAQKSESQTVGAASN